MMTTPKMRNEAVRNPASFRDLEGFLFTREGILFRQINQCGKANYDKFMSSGLYERLVKAGQLIQHEEIDVQPAEAASVYKIIQPALVPFITYPYEWSFSQLKDAALTTLSIQKKALKAGLSLKDASAYNIQFVNGKPALIDTLSFELYREGQSWTAYRQFCQHFLAPLTLMAKRDVRLSQLLRIYIDGIPLDLTSRLLPLRTWFNTGLAAHIHFHAAAQKRYANMEKIKSTPSINKLGLTGLLDNLGKTVSSLKWQPRKSDWGDYYDFTNYSAVAFNEKSRIIREWSRRISPMLVWDLGANTGSFSRIATEAGALTVAADIDPLAVEKNYLDVKKNNETKLLPIVLDLTNPSAGLGWANNERSSFTERGPADLVLALALIHHLAISNNVPLTNLAEFFAHMGKQLIIEFIPKTDSQVQRLLASRKDIFADYQEAGFEAAFSHYFTIAEKQQIPESQRILYLMQRISE